MLWCADYKLGDYRKYASFECSLSGTVLGAVKAWNVSALANEAFESSFSFIMFFANYNAETN